MQLLYQNPAPRQLATTCGTILILLLLVYVLKSPQEPTPGYISAPGGKALARARFINELPFLLNQDIKSVRGKFGYPERVSEVTDTTVTLIYKFAAKGTSIKSKQDYLNEPEVAIKFCRNKVDDITVIYPLIVDRSIGALKPNTALYNRQPNIVLRHNLFTFNHLRRRGFLSPLCCDSAKNSSWEMLRQHLLDLGHLDEHEIHTVTGISEHIFEPHASNRQYGLALTSTVPSNQDYYCSGLVLEQSAKGLTEADFHRIGGRLTQVTIKQNTNCCIFWSSAVIESALINPIINFAQSKDIFGLYRESLLSMRTIFKHLTEGD